MSDGPFIAPPWPGDTFTLTTTQEDGRVVTTRYVPNRTVEGKDSGGTAIRIQEYVAVGAEVGGYAYAVNGKLVSTSAAQAAFSLLTNSVSEVWAVS